ncbi:hypothetical protein TEA_016174 [Camellia sinensis var. sinensis]|uniref:XPG N-terminal domain-containing protein n=1 Tax=Camellia sinensis var. sinensis TaxID=542762 RepID=A0A4S4DVM3_CAMSN|nr:hypothetical protein TEA_016174 [Camellia sinensis var. sinensis]
MGIKGLTKLLADNAPKSMKEQKFESYFGRKVAIDASMSIYQFLIVVGRIGTETLTNEAGEVTSHLQGMFTRTIRLLESGLKPVYVFDGKPPDLKKQELAKRYTKRADATEDLNVALEPGNKEEIEKFSKRTVKVTKQHNDDCKRLLKLMGVPVIEVLEELNLTMNQFIDLCILCGCDYCDSIRAEADPVWNFAVWIQFWMQVNGGWLLFAGVGMDFGGCCGLLNIKLNIKLILLDCPTQWCLRINSAVLICLVQILAASGALCGGFFVSVLSRIWIAAVFFVFAISFVGLSPTRRFEFHLAPSSSLLMFSIVPCARETGDGSGGGASSLGTGIGGQTALKLIRQHGSIENILENINKERYQIPDDWPYQEARHLFKEPLVFVDDEQLDIKWSAPDEEGLINFLVIENGFNSDRITKAIEKIKAAKNK